MPRRATVAVAAASASIALVTTKLPAEAPDDWSRAATDTLMWVLHLVGGAVWVGGLIGLLALALPGGVPLARRGAFWSRLIRRFSVTAMTCVAAILLSGLWLYWEHVDGPSQLLSTLYGRVLGVKLLIFGALFALGAANQFWLHPRIERLRAAGDQRSALTLLAREFPAVVAAEVLLALAILLVAPFLHGSARNEAYQRDHPVAAGADPVRAPQKEPSATTWVYGTAETAAIVLVLVGGYRVSGRLARRRTPLPADGV
jgi:putative copper export protein